MFFKHLRIRDKLLILLAILMAPMVFFLLTNLKQEIEEKRNLQQTFDQLKESQSLSVLLHEIQRERALSLAFLSNKGSKFANRLRSHRQTTDAAINNISKLQESSPALLVDLQILNQLSDFRQEIDRLQVDSLRFEAFNTTIREKVLNRIQTNANLIIDTDIRNRLVNYARLVDAKVYLGRIRTLVNNVLLTKQFPTREYARFYSLQAFYTENIHAFSLAASPQVQAHYQKQVTDKDFREVETFINSLVQNPALNIPLIDSETWFTKSTEAIDKLKDVENVCITESIDLMSTAIREKNRMVFFYIGFVVITLALAGIISYYTITTISGALRHLQVAADKVSDGYTDVVIDIDSKDEIGDLAGSFRQLVSKNAQLSQVAEAVGEGNYQIPIEAASEGDILANALKRMRDKLQRLSRDNEIRQWHLTGISELNNAMSGAHDITETSQKIINLLTSYLKVEVGAIFLANSYNELNFSAGVAINLVNDKLPTFRMGEGMVGQAAASNQVVVLKEVPSEYLRIKTVTADIVPVNIAIVPLYFEKNLIGVIELSSRKVFTPQMIALLEEAADKIAIVIHTLKIHLQTQELLYETQNQAEELETQHEELRQLNVELNAQKEQLQASEEELRVSQEELEEKNSELQEKTQLLEEQFENIREKNKAIEIAKEAVELKMQQVETINKYKSEFLANMSHELRTPLNSILILSKLMSNNAENNLTPKQKEHASIIYNSGSDLLKLINEILDLAKIESGQINLDIHEFKCTQLQIQDQFEQVAIQKNIQFETIFAEDLPPTMKTDQFRVEQIIKNLLSNAFKFTPADGKVTYRIYPYHTRTVFSNPQLAQSTEIIAFSIQDTGIGIPKDKQTLIFEAFQQADASTTRKYGGTGLGLTISRELATLLGGEIRLESEENKGSTFTLLLPRYFERTSPKPETIPVAGPIQPMENGTAKKLAAVQTQLLSIQPTTDAKPAEKKERSVVIIEDDKGFSQIVADFASHKKFAVHQAYTGKEGLELIRQYMPDAVLLDINLPDISGWDILKQLQQDTKLKHIKVHVMSAYDKEVLGQFAATTEDYIPKPVTLEMLDKAFNKIREEGNPIQRVLVVEDHPAENHAIRELLQAHHITSIAALSGNEAKTQLSAQRVDCIILDLNLPDMQGYELMKDIRSTFKELPIIVYSGKDLSEEEEFHLKKFANTIIIKNQFSYIRLLDEVQLFLHKVNEKLPSEEDFRMKLHIPEEVLKDKKVLIVDDDVRNIYSLYNLLEQYQMEIVVANDGKEALQKVQEEKDLDIVLMDIMMPEMDGIETIRHIRKNPAHTKLPIIALTAKAMKGDKEKCLQAGASDYISKPIDTDQLLALMRVWVYKGI